VLELEYAWDRLAPNPADAGFMPRVTTDDENTPRGIEIEMKVEPPRSARRGRRSDRAPERRGGQVHASGLEIASGPIAIRSQNSKFYCRGLELTPLD